MRHEAQDSIDNKLKAKKVLGPIAPFELTGHWSPCNSQTNVKRGVLAMNKRTIIDHIRQLNSSAQPEFLAGFAQEQLLAYLHQLQEVERERRRQQEAAEPVLVGQT